VPNALLEDDTSLSTKQNPPRDVVDSFSFYILCLLGVVAFQKVFYFKLGWILFKTIFGLSSQK